MKAMREITMSLIAELPVLTGTEKQIAYAEDLRVKRIECDVVSKVNAIERKRANRGEEAVAEMLRKAGVETEEEYIEKKIKADMMSAFNAHKDLTTAKDVIEYRVYF